MVFIGFPGLTTVSLLWKDCRSAIGPLPPSCSERQRKVNNSSHLQVWSVNPAEQAGVMWNVIWSRTEMTQLQITEEVCVYLLGLPK